MQSLKPQLWSVFLIGWIACTSLVAQSGQGSATHDSHSTCEQGPNGLASSGYMDAITTEMDHEAPLLSGYLAPIIKITLTASGHKKLVLQTDGERFELLQGAPSDEDIWRRLDELGRLCQLPANPIVAVQKGLIKREWRREQLSKRQFEGLYTKLTTALAESANHARTRFRDLIATKESFVHFHSRRFEVVFDNRFEHFKVDQDDFTDDPKAMDPVTKWCREVLELEKQVFASKPTH